MKPASSVSVPHNINLFRYIGHAKNCQIKINYIIATDLFLFDIPTSLSWFAAHSDK